MNYANLFRHAAEFDLDSHFMSSVPSFLKVLIIATRQIGDTLITTPLIERTHELWPNATIDFLGFAQAISILEGNPYLNECIEVRRKLTWKEYFQLIHRIRNQYDLALITQPSDRSYFYGFLAAPHRVGVCHLGKEDRGWKKWITQDQVQIDYFQQHVVIEKLKLLRSFESPQSFTSPIRITPTNAASLPFGLEHLPKDYVVLHPTPLNAYKRWPLINWVHLIEYFSNHNIPMVLSGGPGEVDKHLRDQIFHQLSTNAKDLLTDTTGQLSFSQLSHLLHQAKAYIGVDTSITHLAAACNTPTIAIFGATPPTNFGPWPNGYIGIQPYQLRAPSQTVKNVTILQGPGDCVPCRKAGCLDTADSKSECLEQLHVERVIAAFEQLEARPSIQIQHI